MLAERDLVAFVGTSDLDGAHSFYGGVLGLRLVERSPFACVFDAHGTMLRVTLADVEAARYTVLGWAVPNLSDTLAVLIEHGVEPLFYPGLEQDAHGVWDAPGGGRVAWFHDPDHNVLSLTQFGAAA